MNRLRASSQSHLRLTAWLLGLALLARLLVPAGWMPSATEGQWISICSGSGTATVWLDADGKAHDDRSGQDQHQVQPCTFSALAATVSDTVVPTIALPALIAVAASGLRPASIAIGRGLAAPPPPKTGPPQLI